MSSGRSLIVEVWSLLTITPVPFHSSFRSTLRPKSLKAALTLSEDCGWVFRTEFKNSSTSSAMKSAEKCLERLTMFRIALQQAI